MAVLARLVRCACGASSMKGADKEESSALIKRLPVDFALDLGRIGLEAAATNHGAAFLDMFKPGAETNAPAEATEQPDGPSSSGRSRFTFQT